MEEKAIIQHVQFDQEQIDLIKRTIAKGVTNDELMLFVQKAIQNGLPSFRRPMAVFVW